jgi:hypothetical protein
MNDQPGNENATTETYEEATGRWMYDYLTQCLDTIAAHGHMVQFVGGSDDVPAFAYTVGLTASDAHGYELALSGLDPDTARNVLNSAADALRDTKPSDGLLMERVLVGYVVRLRRVDREDAGRVTEFGTVRRLYGSVGDVWQVEYPDPAGLFPGQDGYSLTIQGSL